MKITINPYLVRMLEKSKVIVPKLQSALDAAYNQGTKVDEENSKGPKLIGTTANERTGTFTAREQSGTVRVGKLTDPLRFIAWNNALSVFYAKNGEPSGELTIDVVPANLREWIERTMKTAGKAKAKANGKLELPANRSTTPASEPLSNGATK